MQQLSRMIRRGAGLALLALVLQAPGITASQSINYQLRRVGKYAAHVVSIDLCDSSLQVTPAFAYGAPGRRQSFSSFIHTKRPLAQITGVYFGMQNSLPIGDIVINQSFVYDGAVGSALAITADNTADIIDVPYCRKRNWQGYEGVAQGGVRLVDRGRRMLAPSSQGFRDPGLFRPAPRTAVGLTRDKRLLMVAVTRNIYLRDLSDIMRGLGCVEAMSLDGGGSTGLACGHSVIVAPKRALSNVLMVVPRR